MSELDLSAVISETSTAADLVKEVKRASSHWLKTKDARYGKFQWQSGYGAFSIGQSQVREVRHYIENQVEHHRAVPFQEEFRRFLEKYEIRYDERYVWD